MRRILGAAMALAAGLAGTAVSACTAESTIDAAKENRKTDVYKAARAIATEFIEGEKFIKSEATLDAGTGTLVNETGWAMNQGKIPDEGKTVEGWKSILDEPDTTGARHGMRTTGEKTFMNYTEHYEDGTGATIREHLRLHVSQWQDAMNGLDRDLSRWYINEYGNAKWQKARKSIDGSAPSPSAPAPVTRAPPVPASVPAPAPIPEPIVELPVSPEPVTPAEEPPPEPSPVLGDPAPIEPTDPDAVDHAG